MIHKLGYGNWDELKAKFRISSSFKFDWFVKSRTSQELARRCDTLIRLIEKENQEYDERERQARKEKKLTKVRTWSSFKWTFLNTYFRVELLWGRKGGIVSHDMIYKLFQNATPSKRASGRQANESPSSLLKKRKQLSMDDFVSSVRKIISKTLKCLLVGPYNFWS